MPMKLETGCLDCPIWLLGDSEPEHWRSKLDVPLDPRHPARHSIWTPILDVIQDRLFRERHWRLDTSSLYIRNAITDPQDKPDKREMDWGPVTKAKVNELHDLKMRHKPKIIFTFGAFAFEFARRVMCEAPSPYGMWGTKTLGEEFRKRTAAFILHSEETKLVPLLHATIARGKFLESYEYFCGAAGKNYFDYTGSVIANILIKYHDELTVWIK